MAGAHQVLHHYIKVSALYEKTCGTPLGQDSWRRGLNGDIGLEPPTDPECPGKALQLGSLDEAACQGAFIIIPVSWHIVPIMTRMAALHRVLTMCEALGTKMNIVCHRLTHPVSFNLDNPMR